MLYVFLYIINVFTVTFDNKLNKNMNLFKKLLMTPSFWTVVLCSFEQPCCHFASRDF